jgi:hypothetical protein
MTPGPSPIAHKWPPRRFGLCFTAPIVGAEYAKGLRGIGRQALLHGLLAQGPVPSLGIATFSSVYDSDKTCGWLGNHHDWINAPCVCREAATNAFSVFDNYSVAAQYEMFQLLWKTLSGRCGKCGRGMVSGNGTCGSDRDKDSPQNDSGGKNAQILIHHISLLVN